jgi:hypothetical protein
MKKNHSEKYFSVKQFVTDMINEIREQVIKSINMTVNVPVQLDKQDIAKQVSKVKANKIGVFQANIIINYCNYFVFVFRKFSFTLNFTILFISPRGRGLSVGN